MKLVLVALVEEDALVRDERMKLPTLANSEFFFFIGSRVSKVAWPSCVEASFRIISGLRIVLNKPCIINNIPNKTPRSCAVSSYLSGLYIIQGKWPWPIQQNADSTEVMGQKWLDSLWTFGNSKVPTCS